MRKGSEYTISKSQGDAVRSQIAQANGSTFIHIPGIGVTINSADITEMLDEVEQVPQKENLIGEHVLSDVEKERLAQVVKRMGEELKKKGVTGETKPTTYKKDIVWHVQCQVCGKENPEGLARVCSSACYVKLPNPELC